MYLRSIQCSIQSIQLIQHCHYSLLYVNRYSLTTNMRVAISEDASASDIAINLLKLGDGAFELLPTGEISIPDTIGNIVDSRDALLSTIYPRIAMNFNELSWLKERAILAPHNDTVCEINRLLIEKIQDIQQSISPWLQ